MRRASVGKGVSSVASPRCFGLPGWLLILPLLSRLSIAPSPSLPLHLIAHPKDYASPAQSASPTAHSSIPFDRPWVPQPSFPILALLQLIAHPKDYTQPAAQQGAVWEYLGDYWRAREAKEWANCPDLY